MLNYYFSIQNGEKNRDIMKKKNLFKIRKIYCLQIIVEYA